jgi:hypothetical protein
MPTTFPSPRIPPRRFVPTVRRASPSQHRCIVCGASAYWRCAARDAGGPCHRWLCRLHRPRPLAATGLHYCPWHKPGAA